MKLIESPQAEFEPTSKPAIRDQNGRFLSGVGNGGSRGGRPRGARAKFSEQFFEDIRDAWNEHGPSVIARAFFIDPVASLKAVAGLMPREAKLEITQPTDGLTLEKLDEMIALAEAQIAARSGTIEGVATAVAHIPPAMPEPSATAAETRAELHRLDLLDQTREGDAP